MKILLMFIFTTFVYGSELDKNKKLDNLIVKEDLSSKEKKEKKLKKEIEKLISMMSKE